MNKIYNEKEFEMEVKQRAKLDAVMALREAHLSRRMSPKPVVS